MADSVDRVFVHALNTVKKIPKTGASRPPPADRLRLYGLYKQAMEGDVDGVMERPERRHRQRHPGASAAADDHDAEQEELELQRERDKWDAWNAQAGLGRTEAKRRYIEALIDTMHRYATTPDGKGLVAELEFVWDQIKNNSSNNHGSHQSSSSSAAHASPKQIGSSSFAGEHQRKQLVPQSSSRRRRFQQPLSGTEGPMKMLSPMSEDDAAEQEYRKAAQEEEDEEEELEAENDGDDDGQYVKKGDRWSRKVERALVRLSAEVAALREQITAGREWRSKRERSLAARAGWFAWVVAKHFAVDVAVLCVVLLWMRRRKDRRLEDHVRALLKLGREYARKILPSR
ncbi:acyl-CoA binding protein [Durotheca rogersii]|uniref:acyl-CoA binding protein n=1 Tax=Durotheca rogersii TaxID=419775 RepID=UPI00221F81DB|nr:acyl-CoA binding protein [Durotheca rogersii]KAI5864178.1 acyl-CoA binding protein [Durotheca rogersii]